jgi:CDP-diacylglycerol--glycerol-3-phosphate 3-phosphatidyltransferase
VAATLPTFASLAAAAAGVSRRNGGPLGKTERCAFMVLATAFPLLMPVILVQLVNGSLLTSALRLRAAHREMVAQRQQEQQRVNAVALFTAPTQPLTAVAA